MASKYDFNSQYIYDEIVEAQREIQNTKDAYDLEIQASKEQNSILNQKIFNNQINLKKCFSLQFEYAQLQRFDKSKIDWSFFTSLREVETLYDEKCQNWSQFLTDFGAYCRQCDSDNCCSVVDLLVYNTIPTLFGFFSDQAESDDFNSKSQPNFVNFTNFVLKEFFRYEVVQKGFIRDSIKNVSLETRLETLAKFTRSVFVWPPFLHFVHMVFAPIIKKIRSYYSSILTIEKDHKDDLLINTTDCLIKNLLRELRANINLCPIEIRYFLKSIQKSVQEYVENDNSNSNEDDKNNIGLKCASDLFYSNFLFLIFKEPRRFFITDPYNNDSLFKTDSKFDDKLKKSSSFFVEELIKSEAELQESEQKFPNYILIDVFDQKIFEILEEPKENKRIKKTKLFNESLIPNMQIKQYHLFKIKIIQNEIEISKKEKESDDDFNISSEDEDITNGGQNENFDDDFLSYSFDANLMNDRINEFQMAKSLYNLIAYAPPLPERNFELEKEEENKKDLFINVIQKVLVSEVHSLKNENSRNSFFNKLKESKNLLPKNQEKLDSLFTKVKLRANPNSRLLPLKMRNGYQTDLSINEINVKLQNKRMRIRKEREQVSAVLAQESKFLYIDLFRKFLLFNNNVNPSFIEIKNEFTNNSSSFKNYLTNEKFFPVESPSCYELAIDSNESQKCFSFILKLHDIFKQSIGNYRGAEEVIHNSFFRNLTYYSYLVAKPQLIAKDMALSARFVKCEAVSQIDTKSEDKSEVKSEAKNEIKDGCLFYLPTKVFSNLELIEEPRSKIAAALSSDEVPLQKVYLMSRAFKDVADVFILKRIEDIIEVIAYAIASLHAVHFASCYEFVNDFLYHFDDDDQAKLEIFAKYERFFELLSKVSKRLFDDNPTILSANSYSEDDELSLFTQSLDM